MKSRDTLIRLKRFQAEEKRRRVAQIEAMIAEFARMASDLDREIALEEQRSGVTDMAHFGEKVAKLQELRAGMGKSGPFDLSVAPPFRPKEMTKAAAERFLGEVAELEATGRVVAPSAIRR